MYSEANRKTKYCVRVSGKWLIPFAVLILILAGMGAASQNDSPTYRELAEFYAPAIFQDARSEFLDYITRFDFDGDWNGANNWANAYLFELPGYVYYAVIESDYHYFITYAFFHPRDYTGRPMEGFAPKVEHENDLEGCTLLVEKTRSRWGEPLLLQTLAHDKFFRYASSSTDRVHPGRDDLHGSVFFLETDLEGHQKTPAIFIEAEGHGVKAASADVLAEDYEHPGVVYRYTGHGAEVPKNNRDNNVSYELIPIEQTLWTRRYEVGENSLYCCGDSFWLSYGSRDVWGDSFNGPVGGCAARPPWSWDEAEDGISKGDWFRDPLHSYAGQLWIDGFSGQYIYNPYLDPGERAPYSIGVCRKGEEDTTVSKAVTNTLWGIAKVLLSGGLKKDEIGNRASKLFLTNTVLLEWVGKTGFDNWNWAKTGPAEFLPSFSMDSQIEFLQIPVSNAPDLISPAFNAPARYFNQLVVRYRSQQTAQAKLFWQYDNQLDFQDDQSNILEFERSDDWISVRFDLSAMEQWDAERNIAKMKFDLIESASQDNSVLIFFKELFGSADSPLEINRIIFDRGAFADTLARQ